MRSHDGVMVIAEAGVNHNGSIDMALELVEVAAKAGADVVKFQTFSAAGVASAHAAKAEYQISSTGSGESQQAMLKKLELPRNVYPRIVARCKELGIGFMSTAFDLDSLRFLADFDMPATKIPSGDLTASPLVLESAKQGRQIILSTGMCTLEEIEEALGVIAFALAPTSEVPSAAAFRNAFRSPSGQDAIKKTVTLLHCVTEYPAPLEEVNLRAMQTLRTQFGLAVGYSDHTMGLSASLAAVALGATVLEKHFTLDRTLPGPDHAASLEPDELKALVKATREIERVLGSDVKQPTGAELRNRRVARRSLVAATRISRGEEFSESNLTLKRPGTGRAPMQYWQLLGTVAQRDYEPDELIDS